MNVRAAFREQARACVPLGSPFMGRLMSLAAERLRHGTAVADRLLDWTGDPRNSAESVPLRLAGALHALKLRGEALTDVYPPHVVSDDALWSAVEAAFSDHADDILAWLARPPQTNEVRRSAALIPVLHDLTATFGLPIALFELGASGGLNLRADQFRLMADQVTYGPSDSGVVLRPEWAGGAPPPARPEIIARRGVDLNPLDPSRPQHRLRLLAYLWPDQTERLARTEAAIRIADAHPARLVQGDAADWLETELAGPWNGHLRLVFHTIAWQYFPEATQRRAAAAIAAAGARATQSAPIAHFAMEYDNQTGAGLTLTTWPGGQSRNIGRADFHGRWIVWDG